MRRPILVTLAAVGGIVVLLGGTGLFAALSDTSRSGTNSVESGALVASADLQMALASVNVGGVTCKTFTEDLQAAIAVTDEPPGFDTGQVYPYCIRNLGSRTLDLSVLAEDVVETELGCTGDEALYDQTCGGDGPGELGDFVEVQHQRIDCMTGENIGLLQLLLRGNAAAPIPLGTIGPNETRCFNIGIYGSSATEEQRQKAQSDRLQWVFAWTGTVA